MKRRSFDQADQIRLKLQWLEELFQPRLTLVERMFSTTPILPLAVAFIVGIVVSAHIPFSKGTAYAAVALVVGLIALLTVSFRLPPQKRLYPITVLAVALFALLGMVRFRIPPYRGPDHISRLLQDERSLATIRGRIISPVMHPSTRQDFSTIPWLSSQSSFYLSAKEVKTDAGWLPTSGRVRVQVTGTARYIRPGNEVQIYCWLDRFSPPGNPGQFDFAKYMHQRGVTVGAAVGVPEGVEVITSSNSMLFRLRAFFYRFAADSLLDETMTDSDVRALSSALLLGERGDIDPVLTAAFRKTGLSHFISLSGMHVAILAGSLWGLLKWSQIPKRPRAVLCIILLLIYALIVPPRAPTMRAVFLSCFFFASMLIYRKINPLNTLALSAMVLLFIRPYDLFSAGWQLSFLSVLGIIVFYRTIHFYFLNTLFYPCVLLLPKSYVWAQHALYHITELLAVGFSAWITISPILLYYFGQVNPLSPVWTVLVLPAVTIILYAGFLKIALATLLPTLSSLLGLVLHGTTKAMSFAVTLLAKVDLFHITAQRPSILVVVSLYLLLLALCLTPHCRSRLRKTCMLLLILCFLQPTLGRILHFGARPLEMTCLSVGHGQAIVVMTPNRKHLVFDAGSITHQNLARKTICPYLQHRSIFDLDAVCLSHGDLDHINAVPGLAASIPVERVCANHRLIENARQPSLEKRFSEVLSQRSLSLEPMVDFAGQDCTIQSLWPNPEMTGNQGLSENDASQVFLIEYAGRTILLCGDIEVTAQGKLLETYPDLEVDVMVLPHHGSTTNLDRRFIEQLSPSVVIASCSRRNAARAYHPPDNSDTQAFYTAIDGAVTVKIKADGTLGADGFLTSNK